MEQLTGIGQGIFKLATLGGFGAATCAAAFSPSAANISTAFATAAAFAAGSGIFDKRRDVQAAREAASQSLHDVPPPVPGASAQPPAIEEADAGWMPEAAPAKLEAQRMGVLQRLQGSWVAGYKRSLHCIIQPPSNSRLIASVAARSAGWMLRKRCC